MESTQVSLDGSIKAATIAIPFASCKGLNKTETSVVKELSVGGLVPLPPNMITAIPSSSYNTLSVTGAGGVDQTYVPSGSGGYTNETVVFTGPVNGVITSALKNGDQSVTWELQKSNGNEGALKTQ